MATKKEVSKTKKAAKVPAPAGAEWSFAPFMDLRQRMDRMFDEMMGDWHMPSLRRFDPFAALPNVGERAGLVDVRFDVSSSDTALEITAELPGLDEKDVDVTLSEGMLTIKGEKKSEREEKKKDYHLTERRYGSFMRSFRVPESVDQSKIKASFDKGVLSITMPKRPEAKSKEKKIAVSKK